MFRQVSVDGTFEDLVGTVYDDDEPGRILGHFEVPPGMLARDGRTPLGLYATVAEGAASIGTAIEVWDLGMNASGLSNDTTVTHGVSGGRIDFRAECRHHAADLSIWTVEFRGADNVVSAISTVRVAVRPRRI